MMDRVVPTALRGETILGVVEVEEDKAAAEEAIDPGRGEVGVGVLSFLADSCRRVLTTAHISTPLLSRHYLFARQSADCSSPHIGFVPVAVMIPAITAALRWTTGLSSAVCPGFEVGALGNCLAMYAFDVG